MKNEKKGKGALLYLKYRARREGVDVYPQVQDDLNPDVNVCGHVVCL